MRLHTSKAICFMKQNRCHRAVKEINFHIRGEKSAHNLMKVQKTLPLVWICHIYIDMYIVCTFILFYIAV